VVWDPLLVDGVCSFVAFVPWLLRFPSCESPSMDLGLFDNLYLWLIGTPISLRGFHD
jgi:hypothetical protein